jgi:inner membrane protein involved in colicin E2 resistance
MDTAQPPLISAPTSSGVPPEIARRRGAVTLKLLFIAALVLVLQLPLTLVNNLRQERSGERTAATARAATRDDAAVKTGGGPSAAFVAEGYRMVYRSLKYSALILTLVFAAFFLFETLAGLRLHAVHYALVGAAMCLFYLALLALGEVMEPGPAYIAAAVASSLLIVCYSAAILRSWARAGSIAGLLTGVYGVLYVVLRMEHFALLAGTATLFVVLAALMYCTRHVDWFAQEAGRPARA